MQGKTSLFGLLLIAAISTLALFNFQPKTQISLPEKLAFQNWKVKFAKNYQSREQESYRLNVFRKNYQIINEYNAKYLAGQVITHLKLNQFSDITSEEFSKSYLSIDHVPTQDFTCKGPQYPKKSIFNTSFTTDSKMLTPVGEQGGQCVAGYAFATAAAVEASMYKTIKQIVPLSAQQLIDCSQETGNKGCESGNPLNGLHELINRGAMKASDYPYTGRTDTCRYSAAKKVWEVQSCTKVDNNFEMLKSQILEQPVIVGFDASQLTFQKLGTDAIYEPSKCSMTKINHYMLAVGWGMEKVGTLRKEEVEYILVKNSFGLSWADKGYGKVAVRINGKDTGACGMLTYAYFPYG